MSRDTIRTGFIGLLFGAAVGMGLSNWQLSAALPAEKKPQGVTVEEFKAFTSQSAYNDKCIAEARKEISVIHDHVDDLNALLRSRKQQ